MTRKLIAATAAIVCAALWSAAPASASAAWRVQQVPAPANSAAQLQAVSCPAPGICFAVGYSVATGTFTESTLAERWSGGQWAIQPTPSPGTGGIDQLTGISCLSATDCTAVGIIDTQTAANGTLVEHWDGTNWTVVPSPDPAGTTVTDFTGVSCASATSCTAVGLYDTSGHRPHELPLAEHWDGTSWTVTHVPLPDGITAGGLDGGVSCPSATYCIAVGSTATPPPQTSRSPKGGTEPGGLCRLPRSRWTRTTPSWVAYPARLRRTAPQSAVTSPTASPLRRLSSAETARRGPSRPTPPVAG